MTSHPPTVSITEVTVEIATPAQATITILRDLSITAPAGKLTCIHGRSGSGKTTLLRLVAGFITPTRGTVKWDEAALGALVPRALEKLRADTLGYVPQDAGLVAFLTAEENVLLGALSTRASPAHRQRAAQLLEWLGLTGRSRHLPRELSGGERQRVALARALLNSPRLLIIDEPTASLDRNMADQVIATIADLAASGDTTVVVASHDPVLVEIGDHTVLLE